MPFGATTQTRGGNLLLTHADYMESSLAQKGGSYEDMNIKSYLTRCREHNCIEIVRPGSREVTDLRWGVKVSSGASGGSLGRGESFNAASDSTRIYPRLDWATHHEPVEIEGALEAVSDAQNSNTGDDQAAEVFEEGFANLVDQLETAALGLGAGNDMKGLAYYQKQTGDIAGIDVGVTPKFRSFEHDALGAALDVDNHLRLVKREISNRKGRCTEIITSERQADKLRVALNNNVQYRRLSENDPDSEVMLFDGMPVIPVHGFPEDQMVFMDYSKIKVRILPMRANTLEVFGQYPYNNIQREWMALTLQNVPLDRFARGWAIIIMIQHLNRNPYKSIFTIKNLAL